MAEDGVIPEGQQSLATDVVQSTWNTQVRIVDPSGIMAALRLAGLPLAHTDDISDDESSQSALVCIAAVHENSIDAIVACPSGLIYRFEPTIFEQSFWSFAARNYYWVTGCMADREHVSKLTDVPVKNIKGRALSRAKSGLSNFKIDELLSELGYVPASAQTALFV